MDDFNIDIDLDDVADLVAYDNPQDGTHYIKPVFAGMDKQGDAKVYRIIYQRVATIEVSNAEDKNSAFGSVFSEQFGGGKGMEFFKLRLKDFFGDEVTGSVAPYIEKLEAMVDSGEYFLKMTTKLVESKPNDKGQTFWNVRINAIEIVAASDVLATLDKDIPPFDYTSALAIEEGED